MFELLGQSAGDPLADEDDIPVVLRSWQAQNFLVTARHVKGSASNINVLGVMEVQVRPFSLRILLAIASCLSVYPISCVSVTVSKCYFFNRSFLLQVVIMHLDQYMKSLHI